MRTEIHIGVFDLFIFLGVFQGLLLSWFFIKNGNKPRRFNLFQGLLILFLSMVILEELMNNTGFIVKVLPIFNFSEALNFTLGPLFYLFIRSSMKDDELKKKEWVHFIFAFLWLIYLGFLFAEPNEIKYNIYIYTKHPDWSPLDVDWPFSDDPLRIRRFINQMFGIHFTLYMMLSFLVLQKKLVSGNQTFFRIRDKKLKSLRNSTLHFFIIIAVFVFVKLYFGRDLGDYFIATYISFMIFWTSYVVLNNSTFLDQPYSFLELQGLKYKKSSLTESRKDIILEKIKTEMDSNRYFINNMASLSDLAKRIHETTHHVSQVMNEKMNKNFFELLAWYRVEEAKELIKADADSSLTVEELADRVGYNSKSSFNNAFKTLTSTTPSEFRKSLI